MDKGDALDPKGLIREAFRIDGIDSADCRTIFLDWALSTEAGGDMRAKVEALLTRYEAEPVDHPMRMVLLEGLEKARAPARRGGWKSRPR
ncbi:MAG: hypothetical protein AAF922_14225 [Pseudomonadota bacterium]